MNNLIKVVTTERGDQRVSARELHKNLESKKRFSDWWKQWGYKFAKDLDYTLSPESDVVIGNGAVRKMVDYSLTVNMAKNIAMLTDTPRGDEIRDYFIRVEEAFNSPEMMMARAVKYADSQLLGYQERVRMLEADNAVMKPKAIFADAVNVSQQTILVGDLAKMISQNGVEIGQNRLFKWLREKGYLHKQGSQYNRPVQRFIDQGLFKVKESSHANPDGSVKLTFTTKVTGKGQQYFINKFLNADTEQV